MIHRTSIGQYTAIFGLAALLFMAACQQKERKAPAKAKELEITMAFDADSAFRYVAEQVAFGPRVPGSAAHEACKAYLVRNLELQADTVIVQPFKARLFNGSIMDGYNIIGTFDAANPKRALLCAHWDSRPFADHDPDPANHNKSIDGANDGASGVGVLLEVARQFALKRPTIGVDIIFFDLEDYGEPFGKQFSGLSDTWGLGSQYWARNPHKPNYSAKYGILLDMVGAPDATFLMEGFSMEFAGRIVRKVWTMANNLGFGNYFQFQQGGYITDDHYYINKLAGIPTINIIHLDPNSANGSFFEHWHTVNDVLDGIDKETLRVVGLTVVNTVYNEK